MTNILTGAVILITIIHPRFTISKFIEDADTSHKEPDDGFDNSIIDFEEDISIKLNKKYGLVPWHGNGYDKDAFRYTIVEDSKHNINNGEITSNDNKKENVSGIDTQLSNHDKDNEENINISINVVKNKKVKDEIADKAVTSKASVDTTTQDYSVIPLELISTTENVLISIIESTTEADLTVIPLSTTIKVPNIHISDTITLPTSTQNSEISSTDSLESVTKTTVVIDNNIEAIENVTQTTDGIAETTEYITKSTRDVTQTTESSHETTDSTDQTTTTTQEIESTTINISDTSTTESDIFMTQNITIRDISVTENDTEVSTTSTEFNATDIRRSEESPEGDTDVPIYTELDTVEEIDVPEDYYDAKDVVPTTAPKTDALSVIFGLAGTMVESVVESVAERVVPKGIFDLFKRMQRQSEALEAERLRSREENGGLGQFGRGILKSISSGITKPLSQLMAGVRDIGSLDSDRSFVNSLASGVTSVANVANSVVDTFKDRVQAIYPGTVWCGDGRSATARSSDLGLFFFTDTCCRQHDACKIYISSGETKYGLTNTGLFTRSHCSCDARFRECLRRTSSLVSTQIGLTYFNVLGPQCFRRAHPIVRCVRRTRITGQKCEEYELDYTKPRMWQWFDNETF